MDTSAKFDLPVQGIVETCINVADMNCAREFYESVFGFKAMLADERFCAFQAGRDVLLLFKHGTSGEPIIFPGGAIPPHETKGAGHFALAITSESLAAWRVRLHERGIKIESEVQWERGGTSLYFRDPDQNLIELATPGVWPNY
jgi:catechol 2,3-dioxygenase-like lactoylglutathione lyase family enzyme